MTDWNRPQPAPRALWIVIQANLPKARNVGIFVQRNIAGTSTPSLHSEGRALDIGLNAFDPAERVIGDQLFQIFCELGQAMQLEEIIWRRQIWSSRKQFVHAYTGVSAHTDHLHVGFTQIGSQQVALPEIFERRIGQLRTGLEELRGTTANSA